MWNINGESLQSRAFCLAGMLINCGHRKFLPVLVLRTINSFETQRHAMHTIAAGIKWPTRPIVRHHFYSSHLRKLAIQRPTLTVPCAHRLEFKIWRIPPIGTCIINVCRAFGRIVAVAKDLPLTHALVTVIWRVLFQLK